MKNVINIYTLNGFTNYGNRLQLYALNATLRSLGVDCRIYWPKKLVWKIFDFLKIKTPLSIMYLKEHKLYNFTRRYIDKITRDKKAKISVVGSDQVWNPDYLKGWPYLLNVPGESRKISYAASIGRESLTDKQKKSFIKELNKYKAISVRERSAKELLQPLTTKKIEVVLDPTLLLDKKEYEALEAKPQDIRENDKYILCYILGGREQMSAIEKYASDNNLKIIIFSDKKDSKYGVEEFLYLIHHAQLVCTDSFHACVFSFIFERPFVAFKRTGEANYMYTRLRNLMDMFELKNREFNGSEITEENANIDYTRAKEILTEEKKKSLNYLKKALEAEDE